ncbi:MAG: hypothetical protein JNK83_02940 [Rhizobiales bacterium]|nr:hypothetical protein [Hyphomicrobiales bacterium]
MKTWFFSFVLVCMWSGSAFAADPVVPKCQGSTDQRIRCLEKVIAGLERTFDAKLAALSESVDLRIEEKLAGLDTRFDQRYLAYDAVVSLKSERQIPSLGELKCLDYDTNSATTVKAWRCNNGHNNHQAQYWRLIRPVSGP